MLRSFLICHERFRISVHVDHVPGMLNDVADALSRGFSNPSDLGFQDKPPFLVDWSRLSRRQGL